MTSEFIKNLGVRCSVFHDYHKAVEFRNATNGTLERKDDTLSGGLCWIVWYEEEEKTDDK